MHMLPCFLVFLMEFGREKNIDGLFPGSPVVKTSPSCAGGAGSIPDGGAKIPHAS